MLGRILVSFLAVAAGLIVAPAQVPVVGGGTLKSLKDSGNLVTVVLTTENARDANLKITGIFDLHITFGRPDGTPTSYTIASIKEIRVQDEKVEISTQRRMPGGALSAQDEDVAASAVQRAYGLFEQSQGDQAVRIQAAGVLAASGNQDALNSYLVPLSQGNNALLALEAALYMYLAGATVPPEVIERGLLSGERAAKANAATIAGLTNAQQFMAPVRDMLKDTTPEIYPAAAVAAGRLKIFEGLEYLMRGFRALTPEKAEATVRALVILGGPEVESAIEPYLEDKVRQEWFRAARALYRMGNEKGKRLMQDALKSPAFRDDAALILAKDGDWEAQQELRKILDRPFDPSVENLVDRAKIYGVLLENGDPAGKTELLDLMQIGPDAIIYRGEGKGDKEKAEGVVTVQVAVCHVAAALGNRGLMAVMQIGIPAAAPKVALAACEAATAISNPEYGERLRNIRPVYP
ncbi:MAG: hypothetical protein AAB353_12850 [Candidatus Hydrogenedentota bacterium]